MTGDGARTLRKGGEVGGRSTCWRNFTPTLLHVRFYMKRTDILVLYTPRNIIFYFYLLIFPFIIIYLFSLMLLFFFINFVCVGGHFNSSSFCTHMFLLLFLYLLNISHFVPTCGSRALCLWKPRKPWSFVDLNKALRSVLSDLKTWLFILQEKMSHSLHSLL